MALRQLLERLVEEDDGDVHIPGGFVHHHGRIEPLKLGVRRTREGIRLYRPVGELQVAGFVFVPRRRIPEGFYAVVLALGGRFQEHPHPLVGVEVGEDGVLYVLDVPLEVGYTHRQRY